MQNAVGGRAERGDQAGLPAGERGLRTPECLRMPCSLVCGDGDTTVHNLAYDKRLGLWGGDDFPCQLRAEFVEAIGGRKSTRRWRCWRADIKESPLCGALSSYEG